jgi:hypothetical protein
MHIKLCTGHPATVPFTAVSHFMTDLMNPTSHFLCTKDSLYKYCRENELGQKKKP